MSYIIAFVCYAKKSQEFPVQCFRTDLIPGDTVIVRQSDGEIKEATIKKLRYLNWNCGSTIKCKTSECKIEPNYKYILPHGDPLMVGITSCSAFVSALRQQGWIPLSSKLKVCKAIMCGINATHTSCILITQNTITIEIRENHIREKPKLGSLYEGPQIDHSYNAVTHYLSHTTTNLYEELLIFSKIFLGNEKIPDHFFIQKGLKDKRTEELKRKSKKIQHYDTLDLYDLCSNGRDGPAYLSDGLWITSGGRIYE